MPAPKKKTTTSTNTQATATVISPEPLNPETFHQYLRAEIRQATRGVMEEIMREELSHFLGAEWGERTTERKGYRNGFSTRESLADHWRDRRSQRATRSRRSVSHPDV